MIYTQKKYFRMKKPKHLNSYQMHQTHSMMVNKLSIPGGRINKMMIVTLIMTMFLSIAAAQHAKKSFINPILPGFSPDPSICRVGPDFYLVNSSFSWFPGIPIYHSRDLVNWKLIGHGLSRQKQINLDGVKDKDGIWAVTIRYSEGLFYLSGTASKSGGNFYMTAKDPAGEWSDPVWLKNAPGIDGSLFWDNKKCYYIGNRYDFKKDWPGQCAIWIQELDLVKGELVGIPKDLTFGHANNASNTEGAHLYKINNRYLLISAEGGTDNYHAITSHSSNYLFGPYASDKINPVLSHRQLGSKYPIQAVGHADLVDTPNGEWWATVLGKRFENGSALTRETFLCKIEFENGVPIFNPGYGRVLTNQERPNLPWTPYGKVATKDNFDHNQLGSEWHYLRTPPPKPPFVKLGKLRVPLIPLIPDSLGTSATMIKKIEQRKFTATAHLKFRAISNKEHAGIILYRSSNSFVILVKEIKSLNLILSENGKRKILGTIPYFNDEVILRSCSDGTKLSFYFGSSLRNLSPIGQPLDLSFLADNAQNRFNGPGLGVYASSNGRPSTTIATFDWFDLIH